MKINSFQIPEGYIAIGKEMPKKYNFIKKAQGINFYLGLDRIAPDILNNLPQSKTLYKTFNINNFFFDIGSLEIFNNQFSDINGSFSKKNSALKGAINADKLNGTFVQDTSGFIRIELEDTHLQDINFLKSSTSSSQIETINARVKINNEINEALILTGVLNLKNILGKVANLDLSINEFTSTQLNRVQGDLVFGQSRARLASPLFIDTNAAKMKWIGQINKNSSGELSALDLNLDLRVRIGENIPWYAAILGGIPAVAGSAIISEVFESNINELSNYQYEVLGSIEAPKIQRIN